MGSFHTPVLLEESIEALNIQEGGIYVDVTFGGGGHSLGILEKLKKGILIAFDQDENALANAERLQNKFDKCKIIVVLANFKFLRKFLTYHQIEKVDGVLADFGVSTHQFSTAERGFSTKFNGTLDMRMNQNQEKNAFDVVNHYSEKDLIRIFSSYGEVRNAKTLAKTLVEIRKNAPITTTFELNEIINSVSPSQTTQKNQAKVFQAIRIEVNDELGAIQEFLLQTVEVLKPAGRLVTISYHSLEDRMVKNFMYHGNFSDSPKKDFYGNIIKPFEVVKPKWIVPSAKEISTNKKARSAKLRWGIKL